MSNLRIHRQGIRVAGKERSTNTDASVRIYSFNAEVLGRHLPVAGTPLDRPSWNDDFFMHNWVSNFQIHTRYDTSINVSSVNRAEERVGLVYKPYRTISMHWDAWTRADLDQMLINLRGMSSEGWSCPLYGDQIELDQDYTIGGSSPYTLYCQPLQRRFHQNARVAIVALKYDGSVDWVHFSIINNKYSDRLEISSDLPSSAKAGRTLIYPCLDVEPVGKAQIEYITTTKAKVTIIANEVIGDSSLPPSWSGIADGFGAYQSLPIFAPARNWAKSVKVRYGHDGSLYKQGRGKVIDLRGDHPKLYQVFGLTMDRVDAYRVINFFDSRLGRLLPFWTIDTEDIWEVSNISTGYIDIVALGDFSKMQEDLNYIGIKFNNQESMVREVQSFVDNGNTRRLVLSDGLPSNLSVDDVSYCSRARKSRFLKDSLTEKWITDEYCETTLETVEILEEKDISL